MGIKMSAVLCGLFLCVFFPLFGHAERENGGRVLIFNSYHPGYSWSDNEQIGAMETLRSLRGGVDIYVEYLDSKHHSGDDYFKRFKDFLILKYKSKKIDVILLMDNAALDFLLGNRGELFPGVPIVFCGINDYNPAMLRGHKEITGIAQNIDPAGTMDAMLMLHPHTKEILVINDYTQTGRSFRNEIDALRARYEGRVKITHNENLSFPELLERVRALSDGALVLLESFVTDRAGRVYDLGDTTRMIAETSPVAVYGVHEERLGLGIAGGKLLCGRKHGSEAASMAVRILGGEKASLIPMRTQSDARYMFDERVLKRFAIQTSKLPPGSTVINQEISFFAAHKKIIIIASQIIFVLCLVIVLLAVHITQRRRSAAALQESERHFRLLANNAPDGIFILAHDSFTYVNEAFCAIIRADSSQDVLGRSIFDLFSPEAHEKIKEQIRLLTVEQKKMPARDEKILKMDNTWVDVEIAAVPFHVGGDNGALVFVRDISGRKIAEEALRTSEERFRSIVENTEAGYFMTDVSGLILDANPALAKLYGFEKREEIIGLNLLSLQQESERERAEKIFQGMIHEEKVNLSGLFSRRMKDERIGYHTCSAKAIKREGKVIGVEGFMIDATERRLMEAALSEEKERLLVTLRSIGDGVITTDIEGRVMMMNKVAEALTGWSQGEAAGLPMSEVFCIVDERTRKSCENPVEKVLASGDTVTLANHTVLIARDKTERVIADSAAPIRDVNNNILGVVMVFRDMTGKKRMEDAVRNAEKLEAIGILAGGIAHDFNNLLGGIYGYLEMIKRDAERGDIKQITSCVVKALGTYERAKSITQQLLTFSRGGAPIRRTEPLDRLVRESVTYVLADSNVTPVFDIAEGQWFCHCDRTQISQALDNITINARDAMPEGGRLDVSIKRLSRDEIPAGLPFENYLMIAIRDHGKGISEAHMPYIFDPFFTTKKQGSGLGLATSYSIIKKHNGLITAESTPGKGSIFRIYLPEAEAAPKVFSLASGKRIGRKSNGSILVMDDENVILEVVSAMLKAKGYKPVLARNGDEAIALVREASLNNHHFSAAILDLTIPGGRGGKETVRELLDIDADLKVIAASGYSNDPVMATPQEFGFSASLIKPFRLADVEQALKELLS
jgi:PAS domain S-box-containing protein